MRQFVFTIKDDVCAAHGKDAACQEELLRVMTHYGSVDDFDAVVTNLKADWQNSLDNLNQQLTAIRDQELTADEMKVVKNYREQKAVVAQQYKTTIANYEQQLQAVKTENEQRVAKLKAILGE